VTVAVKGEADWPTTYHRGPEGDTDTVGSAYTVTCTGLDVTVTGIPELSVTLSSNDQVPVEVEHVVEKSLVDEVAPDIGLYVVCPGASQYHCSV
jgi:hypothetical protein